MARKKKLLYVFNSVGEVTLKKWVTISKDRYVKETDTPLEDYEDYLLTTKPTNTPYEDWVQGPVIRDNKPTEKYENTAADDYLDYLHDQW